MRAYETARLDELTGAGGWAPIRKHFGVQSFGINAWTAMEAGGRLIPEHDEAPSGHEELYVVLSGKATFRVDGGEVEAPAGTIVFVRDPAVQRGATAAEPGTSVLSAGARPGVAYRPRSWETNAEAYPLWEQGDFEGIKRLMVDALERYEDRGTLLYNLACAEAQLGEADAAIEHLTAAIADRPDLGANARDDTDLDPIRDDPRFP